MREQVGKKKRATDCGGGGKKRKLVSKPTFFGWLKTGKNEKRQTMETLLPEKGKVNDGPCVEGYLKGKIGTERRAAASGVMTQEVLSKAASCKFQLHAQGTIKKVRKRARWQTRGEEETVRRRGAP